MTVWSLFLMSFPLLNCPTINLNHPVLMKPINNRNGFTAFTR